MEPAKVDKITPEFRRSTTCGGISMRPDELCPNATHLGIKVTLLPMYAMKKHDSIVRP
jgi:hypothetical protein